MGAWCLEKQWLPLKTLVISQKHVTDSKPERRICIIVLGNILGIHKNSCPKLHMCYKGFEYVEDVFSMHEACSICYMFVRILHQPGFRVSRTHLKRGINLHQMRE